MTSRDQFEQAYAEDNGMTLLQVVEQRMASGSYRVPAMSRAWFWWQESRADTPALLKALRAAVGFIESHAADPDLSDEMCKRYAEYLDADPHGAIAKATE